MAKEQAKEESWQERLITRFSGKRTDQHRYLTELPELAKHEELYKTPHLRSLYSNSFSEAMGEARFFCQELAQLKLAQKMQLQGKPHDSTSNQYLQELANQQNDAERCYVLELNLFIESVSGLGARYSSCKEVCLAKDPELAKELQRRAAD